MNWITESWKCWLAVFYQLLENRHWFIKLLAIEWFLAMPATYWTMILLEIAGDQNLD